jgi:hypothetical protein
MVLSSRGFHTLAGREGVRKDLKEDGAYTRPTVNEKHVLPERIIYALPHI